MDRFDGVVVTKFFVLCNDEDDRRLDLRGRFNGVEAKTLRWIHSHVRVAFHLSGHLASFDGDGLDFSTGLFRR